VLEFGISLPISSKACQVGFQAALFPTSTVEVALDGLVEQLIDGASFDLTEVLQCGTFFSVNSQRESDPSHDDRLG
jgi:hypothetical protein